MLSLGMTSAAVTHACCHVLGSGYACHGMQVECYHININVALLFCYILGSCLPIQSLLRINVLLENFNCDSHSSQVPTTYLGIVLHHWVYEIYKFFCISSFGSIFCTNHNHFRIDHIPFNRIHSNQIGL